MCAVTAAAAQWRHGNCVNMKWWKDETDSGTGSFWDFPCISVSRCALSFFCASLAFVSAPPVALTLRHSRVFPTSLVLMHPPLCSWLFSAVTFLLYLLLAVISHPLQPTPKKDTTCSVKDWSRTAERWMAENSCCLFNIGARLDSTHQTDPTKIIQKYCVHSFQWSCSFEPCGVFRHLFYFRHILFSFWASWDFWLQYLKRPLHEIGSPPLWKSEIHFLQYIHRVNLNKNPK